MHFEEDKPSLLPIILFKVPLSIPLPNRSPIVLSDRPSSPFCPAEDDEAAPDDPSWTLLKISNTIACNVEQAKSCFFRSVAPTTAVPREWIQVSCFFGRIFWKNKLGMNNVNIANEFSFEIHGNISIFLLKHSFIIK